MDTSDLTRRPLGDLLQVIQVAVMTVDLLEPLADSEERTHHLEGLALLCERYASELDRRDDLADLCRGFGASDSHVGQG